MGLISETKIEILRHIQSEPDHGYGIAQALDLSHGYIYTHLGALQEAGMIEIAQEQNGKKLYQLTTNGEYLLKAFEEDP